MKYLAIDYGLKRSGIAVTDPDGLMAFPLQTIHMGKRKNVFVELACILDREKPDALIIGLPLLADGQESLITKQVRHFTARLARRTLLPIYFMPELLSSYIAEADLREVGRKHIRSVIDQQAAVRILESFLNTDPFKRIPYVRPSS